MVDRKPVAFVIVLATGVILGLSPSATAAGRQAVAAVSSAPRDLTFCELAKEPVAFDGARIRLTSIINFDFEDFRLWDPTCVWTKAGWGLWVTYGGRANSGAIYCCPGEGLPRSSPVSYPLVEDQAFRKLRALLTKEKDVVVRATLVGTVLTRREGNSIEPLGGYGHLGCCSLFVIERVESFEPHTRKDLDYSASAGFNAGRDLRCKESGGVQGDLRSADGQPFHGASFDGGETLLGQQAAADAGDRPWLFVDPGRVALEAVRAVHGNVVPLLKRIKSTQRQQIFEWKQGRYTTTVVVARPYWLSLYSESSRVAWVVTAMNTAWCD